MINNNSDLNNLLINKSSFLITKITGIKRKTIPIDDKNNDNI